MITYGFEEFIFVLVGVVSVINFNLVDPDVAPINVPDCEIEKFYDYIIVGSGSAGSVLASRLTENPDNTVLLLEKGGRDSVISEPPNLFFQLLSTQYKDYKYYVTEPQTKACRVTGGVCIWPRGEVLGGCSTINAMIYLRGNKKDYDGWEAMGNYGWAYNSVLPYFKKSEDMRVPEWASDTVHHGTGGYLTVSRPEYVSPMIKPFLDAGQELGYQSVDANGAVQRGFTQTSSTIRNGVRCSVVKAFLRPARNRCNLDIALNSRATKILIDPLTKIAYGVEFVRNGKTRRVYATQEVIVSAGVIGSPQLLQASGVGPSSVLTPLGIPVIKNSPVGLNLQDHISILLSFLIDAPLSIKATDYLNYSNILNFAVAGAGPLSAPGIGVIAFVDSPLNDPSITDYPDVELHLTNGELGGPQPEDKGNWVIAPVLLRPKSTGSLRIVSQDTAVPPSINPNYFADDSDRAIMIEAIRMAINVSDTQAFQAYNSRLDESRYTACNRTAGKDLVDDDDYISCLVFYYTETIYHPTCSCKMGPKTDPTSVVDPELRMIGVRGLRVVDASIMPKITSGNTNAPTIMIAEKASDMIENQIGYFGWPM